MSYRVGDKVKVLPRDKIKTSVSGILFASQMDEYCDKEYTVSGVSSFGKREIVYFEEITWTWDSDWLVPPKREIDDDGNIY